MTDWPECIPSGILRSRRHRFEARYDTIPPPELDLTGAAGALIRYAESLTKRIYVADVCVHCGMTVLPAEDREVAS